MILWLVGMMGTGKTDAGRLAAGRLGVPFHDTDLMVVEQVGCSIAELWEQRGEGAFREIEKIVMEAASRREGIVATGGGVVLDVANRALMSGSPVIWLEAPVEILLSRLGDSATRPGLVTSGGDGSDFLERTLAARAPHYAEVATHRVDSSAITVDEVARIIEDIWRS